MKHVVNFRLTSQAINTLSILEKKLHTSKTAIVEKALQNYAKKELLSHNPLLAYAGTLDGKEASTMLDSITSSKYNKNLEVDL